MSRTTVGLAMVLFLVAISISACGPYIVSRKIDNKIAIKKPLPGVSLRHLAERRGILIGTATKANFWELENIYAETIKKEFNFLTPETQMKWKFIHPQRDRFDWFHADRHVLFAEANQMKVHGHTLVWHHQNPKWLNDYADGTAVIEILREHIKTIVGRYKGRVALWDVINEALDGRAMRRNIWFKTIGPEYIDMAFRFAHEADPGATLIYNDYDIAVINSKSDRLYYLLKDMLARGIPIHGVGFQLHITGNGIDYQSFAENMRRFAKMGLQLFVTELDVRLTGRSDENYGRQAKVYENILKACLEQPSCKAVQLWGFTDRHSWIPSYFSGYGWALPFDENYDPKPAYYAIQQTLLGSG